MKNKVASIILCLVGLFITTSLFAKTVLHGTIKENTVYFNYYDGASARKSFPQKHYEFYLYAYDLKYHAETNKIDYFHYPLSDLKGRIKGNLDLISADKNTDTYHFRLSFESIGVTFTGWTAIKNFEVGGYSFDSNITLADQSSPVFDFIVKLTKDKIGKPELITLNNNPYFKLEFYGSGFNLNIMRISDIPVIITKL